MTQLSEIISLPVFSINDRKKIGSVENILLNQNRVKYYVVYDEENDIKYLLSPNKIYGTSSFCITIKNMQNLILSDSEEKSINTLTNPINSVLISTMGEDYGIVKDIVVENNIVKEIVGNVKVPYEKVLCMGENLTLVKSKNGEKISNFAIKKTAFKSEKEIKVSIQNSVAPLREVVNNNMLLGRKTTQDIMGLNNEIIVRSGTIINTKVLNRVKYSGKLKELTLYSK